MNATYRPARIAASIVVASLVAQAQAAGPRLPRDGWVSWQVPAIEAAPAWCCFNSWNDRDPARMTCKLDGSDKGYGISDNYRTTDTVKVYARTAGGKLERLQVLAAACPVETRTPVQSLDVPVDDSARWLAAQVEQAGVDKARGHDIGENALAALAMHGGDVARNALSGFTQHPRNETRKKTVFWMSILRGEEGANAASNLMFNDKDPHVREHAALALAQSRSTRVTADLIKLGNTDQVGDVRSKAWFWLAQTAAPEAEAAIGAALRKDPDEDVREQAVFALSRLPDERATRALIAAAEDQSLDREQRKKAVFWLSQSNSDAAQAYLEKVLARQVH